MSSKIHIDTSTTAKELATLINDAPRGATIQLEAGNYTFDDGIAITRSDISVVGAGSGKTTLTFTDNALDRNDSYGLHLDGSDSQLIGKLSSSASEGSSTIKLDNASALNSGDTVRLWQDNDSAYFSEIGDTSWREANAPLRTSMAKVTSVNGDSVTLDRGVHFDFDGGKTQIERLDTLDNVTLKGFSLGFELGTPDKSAFENKLSGLKDYQAIWIDGTADSQLSDIQVLNGPSIAYHFDKTLDTRADHIEAHGTFNKGSGGNGYAFELRESYDGTFTNLEDTGMRHGLIFASWRSSVGNDAHVKSTDRDINFHGGQDHDNTVRVEQSIRDADADVMSTTLWYNNGGESFGAITEAGANQVTFDYVVGSRRDDVLQGSDDGVYLDGGLGHDTLTGGKGDDILKGGPADDWGKNKLDGGTGSDTVMYMQGYADVDVSIKGDEVSIGKDTLINIEQVMFGDGTLLDVSSGSTSKGGSADVPSPDSILGSGGASVSMSSSPSTPAEEVSNSPSTLAEEAGDASVAEENISGSGPEATSSSTGVTISYNRTSSWNDGYVAEVFVENTSNSTITNPEVQFDLPADIDTVWNGLVSEDGSGYRVTDNNTNVLEPGETWRFAYKAYGDDQSLPDEANLQGGGSGSVTMSNTPSTPAERADDASPSMAEENISGSGSVDTTSSTDVTITHNMTSSWNDGYVTEVFVENTSNSAITNPEVQFDLAADIDTVWNGLVSEDGSGYRVTDNNANVLEPGETWRFAYKAYGDDQSLPDEASVQGDGTSAMEVAMIGLNSAPTDILVG